MSKSFYKDPIRIHCPCADSPADAPPPQAEDEFSTPSAEDPPEQVRRIFDPSLTRAKYSLHPLAYLYFCQECQAIRCPRCVQEEIVSAFCPMCLFEVPLTSIKADGNRYASIQSLVYGRCVRNCFQCPICSSGLSVFPNEETQAAPYTLNCMYCQWSSTEIGVEFEKPTGISGAAAPLFNL
jgi:dynactin 4